MSKYTYQTQNGRISSRLPEGLDWHDFTDLPPEYGWFHSDDPDVPWDSQIKEDGTLVVPEPPVLSALQTPMTRGGSWVKVARQLNKKDPLVGAVLQLIVAKIEQNEDVAAQALSKLKELIAQVESSQSNEPTNNG